MESPQPNAKSNFRTRRSKMTTKIGRSAKTGQFVPVKVAKDKPSTHVVETIKKKPK